MNLPDDFCLLSASDTPKETTRDAYNAACVDDVFSGVETPQEMFRRTGRFLNRYSEELNERGHNILDANGLVGGVVRPRMSSLKNLSYQDALDVWNVTFALLEFETVWKHFIETLSTWYEQQLEEVV